AIPSNLDFDSHKYVMYISYICISININPRYFCSKSKRMNMENPFMSLEKRLLRIEGLIHNLDQNFLKSKLSVDRSERLSEYMDAQQVAELARVKLTTIYAYNTRNTIPIYSFETPIIYKRDEIIEWLGNGKQLTPRLQKLMEERRLIKK